MKPLASLALALAFGVAAAAHADPVTFNLTASGDGFSTSEVLTAVDGSGPGTYEVTAVSGTVTLGGITLAIDSPAFLPDPSEVQMHSPNGNVAFDQIYYGPAAAFPFDESSGLLFTDVDGNEYSLRNDGTNDLLTVTVHPMDMYSSSSTTITIDITGPAPTTPEPPGFILLGTGIIGVAGAALRRFGKARRCDRD
jgi:hypothetical protein